jgi:hypothetical protein
VPDPIYHLERIGAGRYRCKPKGIPGYEVEVEDAIMKPLVSGPEARRYEKPEITTYLLFPYKQDSRGVMRLISADEMRANLPKAWAYLVSFEVELRARENGKMNRDAGWWGYVYPKNLSYHDKAKLIVAQTVPEMRVCADTAANKYLNNVRVNGILPAEGVDLFYLLGVLNGPVADFVFRRIGKPKQGGWFEANKQFIAPLPIPDASPEDRADIAARARALQTNWTERRDLAVAAEERLSVLARTRRPARWLWPDLPELPTMIAEAPKALKLTAESRDWAGKQLDEMEASRLEALQTALDGGGRLEAQLRDGELTLLAGGATVLDRIYVDEPAGRLAEAYWRLLLLSREWREAGRLAAELRRSPSPANSPAATQFIERVEMLAAAAQAIEAGEREMNERLFELYDLTPDERLLVESGRN